MMERTKKGRGATQQQQQSPTTKARRRNNKNKNLSDKKKNTKDNKGNVVVDVVLVGVLLCVLYFICSHLVWMEELGMPLLLSLQEIRSTPLDALVRIFSALGVEMFFLLIPFSLFWLSRNPQHQSHPKSKWKQQWPFDHFVGMELLLLLLLTWFCNSTLKTIFARPRPWNVHSHIDVHHSTRDTEFSFPSGHSWSSAISWLFVHYRLGHFPDFLPKLKWVATRFGLLLTFMTSSSRVYFGVHYPHDILSGWMCAIILFTLYKYLFISHPSTPSLFSSHSSSLLSRNNKNNKNKKNNKNEQPTVWDFLDMKRIAALGFILVAMVITVCYLSTVASEAVSDHVGFFYCPGVVLSLFLSLITNPFLAFYFQKKDKQPNKEEKKVSRWRQLLRFVVGISGGSIVMLNKQWVIASSFNSFVAGFLSSAWLVWGAPLSFFLLSLN